MGIVIPNPITITPSTHRFFDDLITALASEAALTAGYVTHAQGKAYRFLDDWQMSIGCLTRREARSILEIGIRPASILTPLTKFTWPTSLDLTFRVVTNVGVETPAQSTAVAVKSPLTGIKRINANIIEHSFLAYYERNERRINGARRKPKPTLAFANVIRNAFAHGGVICFEQKKAHATVSWSGLSYSINDNGRQVMYNDMSMGDVILLMLEMDSLF